MQAPADDITGLLVGWREGNSAALDALLPLIQRELNRIARRHLGHERQNHSIQPSSLVQEAFLRLLPDRDVEWQNRAHFFAVASTVMRHVLVDHARQRSRAKRGGAAVHVPVDVAAILSPDQVEEVVAIDLALAAPGGGGRAQEPGIGDAFLRRTERGRNRGSLGGGSEYGDPRLEFRPGVAPP